MPIVSVIIPTYQCGRYISQAIDSVLAQTFKDLEIIIVDDGSTDNTQVILSEYSLVQNIRIILQSNQGPAAARNCGIKISSGEYIAFLDADDLWLPNKLEKQITFLDNNPLIDLVFCDAFIFNEKYTWQKTHFKLSPPASGRVFVKLFLLNFIPCLTVVVRRSIFNTIGFFDESLIGPEDYDLWLRICQTKIIAFIQEPLAKYRISSGQLSNKISKMIENEINVKEKALRNSSELRNLPNSLLDQGYYNRLLRLAKLLIQNHQNIESRRILEKYKLQRGFTFRYLAIRTLLTFPDAIQRLILFVWDSIKTKHVLEKNWNA